MYQSDIISSIEKLSVAIIIAAVFSFFYFIILKISELIIKHKVAEIPQLCLTAFVFGLLALVAGIVTGASRNSAVGDVLPAALGLIGAVALYVITKNKSEMPLAMTAVISFSALLLQGTVLGSYERARSVAYQESLKFDFESLKAKSDIEFFINGYRRSRGLEPLNFSN